MQMAGLQLSLIKLAELPYPPEPLILEMLYMREINISVL